MVHRIFATLRHQAAPLLRHDVTLRFARASAFPNVRDYAFTDGKTIWVAPKIRRASADRIAGLLAHELGHCVLIQNGHQEHSERDADSAGAQIAGLPLGYDSQDVQRLGCRRRRPPYLPA